MYKNILMGPEMGRVCHLVVLKGILVTIVRAEFFKIRFLWKKYLKKTVIIGNIILRQLKKFILHIFQLVCSY